jgi:pyrimidine-nucleoside phosphorylase
VSQVIDIISKKRDGKTLSTAELDYIIHAYLREEVADYQMSALLMAIFIQGLDDTETQALTEVMLHSGEILNFSALNNYKVDKHSTGGVGDKTSLVVAPIAAAAGLFVPMISGRALGHAGGTVDKLDSIPGYRTDIPLAEFKEIVFTVGTAIIGQSAEIAPADRKIYALRDVTATINSIPLITASIMSKKLAAGLDGLVLDVKCGNGAFMPNVEKARMLAQSMVTVGQRMQKQVVALITDMEQPLGNMVGNALEVMEAIEVLQGQISNDFSELCYELAAVMLWLGKAAPSRSAGRVLAEKLINNGAALEKFCQMVEAQGGNPRIVDDFQLLPQARERCEIFAPVAGYVTAINTHTIGSCAMALGAGRTKVDDEIDYSVGLQIHAKIGTEVGLGSSLCTVYYNDPEQLAAVKFRLREAYQIETTKVAPPELIKATVGAP